MRVDDIQLRVPYGRGSWKRRVAAIEGDDVIYTVDGITSFIPFRSSAVEFVAWVERQEAQSS